MRGVVKNQIAASTNLNNHLSGVFEARGQPAIQIKESGDKAVDDSDSSDVSDEAGCGRRRAP